MTAARRKKLAKRRGHKTHGWGAKKKHRGSGNRGGKGMAGSGKRADQKKPTILKLYGNSYFGRKGFKKKNKRKVNAVNIDFIENKFDDLLSRKLIKEEKGSYIIDLKSLGFNKLLSFGKVTKKFSIKTRHASKKAVEKIKVAGGAVDLKK